MSVRGWCVPRGGCVCPGGVCPGGGVSAWGCLPRRGVCVSALGVGVIATPWTDWLADRCKNITFPQLHLRAVKKFSPKFRPKLFIRKLLILVYLLGWMADELICTEIPFSDTKIVLGPNFGDWLNFVTCEHSFRLSVRFRKSLALRFPAIPWLWLVQFPWNGKMSIGCEQSRWQECSLERSGQRQAIRWLGE